MMPLSLLFLVSHQLLGASLALCPAPFAIEAGSCVYVTTVQNYSWCAANQRCASIGGELLNSYEALSQLVNMPTMSCACDIWLGISDIGDERNKSKSGWQSVHDRGVLPLNESLWRPPLEPDNINNIQDCLGQFKWMEGKLSDMRCSKPIGYACEYFGPSQLKTRGAVFTWKATEFKRTSYNPSAEYCYTDVHRVDSAIKCLSAAGIHGSSRHVLYNKKMQLCRLLQYTDAQVEQEIENSDDWKKYSLVSV